MTDLKPCPICARPAEIRDDSDCVTTEGSQPYWVSCSMCSCSVEGFYEVSDAIEAWNTRAPHTEAQIEAAIRAMSNVKHRNIMHPLRNDGVLRDLAIAALKAAQDG
ncbi:MAG: Lar family restriction alleviation protein [Nitrosomonadaceae bacterium]